VALLIVAGEPRDQTLQVCAGHHIRYCSPPDAGFRITGYRSVGELEAAICDDPGKHKQKPKRFKWTKAANNIIARVSMVAPRPEVPSEPILP